DSTELANVHVPPVGQDRVRAASDVNPLDPPKENLGQGVQRSSGSIRVPMRQGVDRPKLCADQGRGIAFRPLEPRPQTYSSGGVRSRPQARMDVPKGIGNGNAVSMSFNPCINSRAIPFGGIKPRRSIASAVSIFAPRRSTLRAIRNGTIRKAHA